MQVIRSHKTLFKKAAILGFIITAASSILFLTFGRGLIEGPENFWNKEAMDYYSRLDHGASHFMDQTIAEMAARIVRSTQGGADVSAAFYEAEEGLNELGIAGTRAWLSGTAGDTITANPEENHPAPPEIGRVLEVDSAFISIVYQNECYFLSTRSLGSLKGMKDDNWTLSVAVTAKAVYARLDLDNRVVTIEVFAPNGAKPRNDDRTLVAIPIYMLDGSMAGNVYIRTVFQSFADKYLWGWQVTLLGLLPIISVILFFYLIIRYLRSFSDHSALLGRLLRSDKPGVEIFRRDQYVMEKFMPELAELFSLAGESSAEKMYFKKSLEQFGMTLEIIEDKGFEGKSIGDVLEFLLRGLPDCGGAVFSSVQTSESSSALGRYNISDDIVHALTATPRGLGLLKIMEKLSSRTNLHDIKGLPPDGDLLEIFAKYPSVCLFPLRLKGRLIGILLLVSGEDEMKSRFFSSISDLLIDLIAVLTFGVLLEKDKQLRAEGTRILQETSLAISSTLDLPSVLRIVAHRLSDYTGAAYCMILLNLSQGDEMEVASFFNRRREAISAPAIDKIILAEFPGLARAVRANRATVLERQDIQDFSKEEKAFINAGSIESLTVLPIAHSAKFIGSIVLGEERSGSKGTTGGEKLIIIQAIAFQAASAIENARLYGFIKQKVDQLTATYNVSAVINSEIDIDNMLTRVLEATKEYLNFRYSIIYSTDDERRVLLPMVFRGFQPDSAHNGNRKKFNDSIAGLVASTGESVIIDDTRLDSSLKSSFPGALSELAVPIKISDKIVGIFSVGSDAKNAFTVLDEEFLQSLAAQIAVAMGKARLFEKEKERGKRLKTIYEFSRQTSKSLNLNEVLELAVDSVREAFKYQLVMVILKDNERGEFYLARQSSVPALKFPENDFRISDGSLLARTANLGRTLYCADAKADPGYVPGVPNLRSEVCIPIMSAEKIIGVLGLGSTSPDYFTTEDINTIEALSDILGVAIEKSFLFRETIEKADRLSLMDKINTAISAALDLDSFFKVVAKAVSDNAGYKWTLLVVPDGDSYSCKAGYSPSSLGDLNPAQALEILHDKLTQVFTSKTAEFVSFAELADLGKPEKLQPAVDAGIRHLVLLPIGEAEKCEAVLTVGSSSKDGFTAQELSLLHDITIHLRIAWQNASLYEQLKTAYRKLQEAQDRVIQSEKLRALGEMSSGVVHDFNNILAAILGRVQLMIKKMTGMSDQQWLKFFEKNLSVIETAVKDGSIILSRISEFTKKKPTESFISLNLDQIISDVLEMTRPRWYNQAIAMGRKIDIAFEKSGNLQVLGSPSELREVFTNLINNAIDAVENGGRIRINAGLEGADKILVCMEDTGSGMSEETKKRIFEPFFTTKGKSGTGLGLSITYGIINRHGGTIDVESQIGVGTKFKIMLPYCKEVVIEKLPEVHEQMDHISASILVVDDEESLREILSEILESVGHRVDLASGGALALEAMARKKYDLVITDLGMDDVSGWDVADEIYKKYPSTKVILATGWGAQVEPGNLAKHHVNSMINKPFKISEITNIVVGVLTRARDEVLVDQV